LRILQASTRAASFFAGRTGRHDDDAALHRQRDGLAVAIQAAHRADDPATDAEETRKGIERQTVAPLARSLLERL
jgi:hypothetical protein